jgi:hypothetical protein
VNPFRVLDVGYDAPRMEIERAAQKRTALCAVGAAPVVDGTSLTADLVRAALITLRDPEARWQARLDAEAAVTVAPAPSPTTLGAWLGWGGAAPPIRL